MAGQGFVDQASFKLAGEPLWRSGCDQFQAYDHPVGESSTADRTVSKHRRSTVISASHKWFVVNISWFVTGIPKTDSDIWSKAM